MARAFVTGATGFIGSHLIEALVARGDQVRCLVRSTSDVELLVSQGVDLVDGDLDDAESLSKAVGDSEVVYHLAGLIKWLADEDLIRTNVDGTRNLVQACVRKPNPPTLLFLSSLSAAGPAVDGRLRTEADPCRPVSIYGESKRTAEILCAGMADQVPVTILRAPIVFGARDTGSLDWFKSIRRTRVHAIPGYARRHYALIHAADLVRAIIMSAERGTRIDPADAEAEGFRAGCYFVADSQQPSYGEIGKLVAKSLGRRFVIRLPFPDFAIHVSGRVNDRFARLRKRPHIFSADKAREATAGSWTCSSEKIESELGFAPEASLAERFCETAEWYRAHGWL